MITQYYDISAAKIKALFRSCERDHLIAPHYFWSCDRRQLQAIYNGVGPAAWAPWLRKIITWLLRFFEEDALIHDVMFELAPRTFWAFILANAMFFINACIRAVRHRKYANIFWGFLLAILCQLGGWCGFKNNVKTNKESDKQNAKIIHYRSGTRRPYRRGL